MHAIPLDLFLWSSPSNSPLHLPCHGKIAQLSSSTLEILESNYLLRVSLVSGP